MPAARNPLKHVSVHIGRTMTTMSPLLFVALLGIAAIAILSGDFYLKGGSGSGHRVRAVHGKLGRSVRVLRAGQFRTRLLHRCRRLRRRSAQFLARILALADGSALGRRGGAARSRGRVADASAARALLRAVDHRLCRRAVQARLHLLDGDRRRGGGSPASLHSLRASTWTFSRVSSSSRSPPSSCAPSCVRTTD